MFPKSYKFLSIRSKVGCKLLTQIRVGRSNLNFHSFSVGKTSSPECICHFPQESPTHFFLECFLYNEKRRTLLSTFQHLFQNSKTFLKRKCWKLFYLVMILIIQIFTKQMFPFKQLPKDTFYIQNILMNQIKSFLNSFLSPLLFILHFDHPNPLKPYSHS